MCIGEKIVCSKMEEKIFEEKDSCHETDEDSLVMPSFNRVRDNYLKRIENEEKISLSLTSQFPSLSFSSSSAMTTGGLTPWNNLFLLVSSSPTLPPYPPSIPPHIFSRIFIVLDTKICQLINSWYPFVSDTLMN